MKTLYTWCLLCWLVPALADDAMPPLSDDSGVSLTSGDFDRLFDEVQKEWRWPGANGAPIEFMELEGYPQSLLKQEISVYKRPDLMQQLKNRQPASATSVPDAVNNTSAGTLRAVIPDAGTLRRD